MTGNEFTAAIEGLGLSQAGAARMLGTETRTVRRWVSGAISVPWAVYLVLWFIEKFRVNTDEIPRKPTRAEQRRLDEEWCNEAIGDGIVVGFTRRQPPDQD
jgi:hypothetical protein